MQENDLSLPDLLLIPDVLPAVGVLRLSIPSVHPVDNVAGMTGGAVGMVE